MNTVHTVVQYLVIAALLVAVSIIGLAVYHTALDVKELQTCENSGLVGADYMKCRLHAND